MSNLKLIFKEFRYDLPASIVVFFVALPLCLGVALASGAPLFSGLIAGIVGGLVVGISSGSPLGVSGPTPGLVAIVLSGVPTLGGSWEVFLLAVVLAGVIQLILGYLKFGTIAYYFPSSVIKGVLSGIGLLIILKQIPHAFGYDKDFEGDDSFIQVDGQNTFSELLNMLNYVTPAAVIIVLVSLFILILWEQVLAKKGKIFNILNGPLVAVIVGIILNQCFANGLLPFQLESQHIVQIPVAESVGAFFAQFSSPSFSQLTNIDVYTTAFMIAVIASLETLLTVEVVDKLDSFKRVTPTNRELKAQGIGNIISGLIGGLPVAQVIVRSGANISFGGRTKMSTILHGIFLLICVLTIPSILNMIPLASLSAILLVVGYKLTKPTIYKQVFKQGYEQFIPFIATIVAILFTDLLQGIVIGMAVGVFYILRNNFENPYYRITGQDMEDHEHTIMLAEEVSFLNKGSILKMLNHIPAKSKITIDATKTKSIHIDIVEIIHDYKVHAEAIGVELILKGEKLNKI